MNQSQLLFGYHRRWRVRHLSLCVTLPPLVAFWKFVENLEWYRGRYSSNPGISGRQNSFFVALGRNHHLGAAPLALPRRPSIVSCGISRHFWWHALCHNIRIWRCLIIYWTPISILWCASWSYGCKGAGLSRISWRKYCRRTLHPLHCRRLSPWCISPLLREHCGNACTCSSSPWMCFRSVGT